MTGKYVTQGRVIYFQPPGEPTEGRRLIGWASSTDDAGLICEELNRLVMAITKSKSAVIESKTLTPNTING